MGSAFTTLGTVDIKIRWVLQFFKRCDCAMLSSWDIFVREYADLDFSFMWSRSKHSGCKALLVNSQGSCLSSTSKFLLPLVYSSFISIIHSCMFVCVQHLCDSACEFVKSVCLNTLIHRCIMNHFKIPMFKISVLGTL